jgi:hypothetical protein
MEETFHQWSRTPDVRFIEDYSGVDYQAKLLGVLLHYKVSYWQQSWIMLGCLDVKIYSVVVIAT